MNREELISYITELPSGNAIQRLYVAYFGRPADRHGIVFWDEQTTSLSSIGNTFGYTSEYLDSLPAEPAAIINELYQRMFDRDVGDEGLAFYLDELQSGKSTLASLPLDILNGASGNDVIALDNKTFIANVFTHQVIALDPLYNEAEIPAGRAVLQIPDSDSESIDYGILAAIEVVDTIIMGRGEFFPADFIPPDPWLIDYTRVFEAIPLDYRPDPFPGFDVDVL